MGDDVRAPVGVPPQRNMLFWVAVLCVLASSGLALTAIYHGSWLWAAWCGLAFAVCVVAAFYVAVREA